MIRGHIRDYLTIKIFPMLAGLFSFETYPYLKLFALVVLEEAGVPLPIPGDAILAYFGFKSHAGAVNLAGTLTATMLATLLGASVLYYLGWRFGRPLIERYGGYIHVSHHDLSRMERWTNRYGLGILILARMVPGFRIIGTLAAGILHLSYRTFILATAIGTLLWVMLYFYLGVYLGKRYSEVIDRVLQHHVLVPVVLLASFVGWFLFLRYGAPRLRSRNSVSKDAASARQD